MGSQILKFVSLSQCAYEPMSLCASEPLRLPSEQILQNENRVCRPLCKSPHQVWVPLRSERDVDAHAPAVADQLFLKIAADAVKHLKLKCVISDLFGARECERGFDHLRVVRGDAVIGPALQQDLHQRHEIRIDVFLRLERDLSRLLVRALAEADANLLGAQVPYVALAAMQIRLDHRADVSGMAGLRVQLA